MLIAQVTLAVLWSGSTSGGDLRYPDALGNGSKAALEVGGGVTPSKIILKAQRPSLPPASPRVSGKLIRAAP